MATDDTFCFHKSESLGRERLRRLDAAFERHGVPKNAEKDATLASAMIALGCQLTARPPAAEPVSSKLVPLFGALLDVFLAGKASPRGMNRALVGLEQWFCLLTRPMFSVLARMLLSAASARIKSSFCRTRLAPSWF